MLTFHVGRTGNTYKLAEDIDTLDPETEHYMGLRQLPDLASLLAAIHSIENLGYQVCADFTHLFYETPCGKLTK